MAKQTTIDYPATLRKQQLISQLANSRREISSGRGVIKQQLNPKTQLTSLFSKNPKGTLIGSAVLGLVLTSLFRRKKVPKYQSVRKRRGIIMTLAGWALALAKPNLKTLLIKQATTMATKQLSQRQNPLPTNRQDRGNQRNTSRTRA